MRYRRPERGTPPKGRRRRPGPRRVGHGSPEEERERERGARKGEGLQRPATPRTRSKQACRLDSTLGWSDGLWFGLGMAGPVRTASSPSSAAGGTATADGGDAAAAKEVEEEEAHLTARCGGEGALAALLREYDFARHHSVMAQYGGGGSDNQQLAGVLWGQVAVRSGNLVVLDQHVAKVLHAPRRRSASCRG